VLYWCSFPRNLSIPKSALLIALVTAVNPHKSAASLLNTVHATRGRDACGRELKGEGEERDVA